MPGNTAAWLTAEKARPLEVKSAPYPSPEENEIIIKNGAVAINPVDWAIQAMGDNLFKLPYPLVGGSDVAGEVVEIGPNVTRFKPGDRVLSHALALSRGPSFAAFQAYTVCQTNLTSPIPPGMSYETASVMPLGLSTAACGLYQKDFLALPHPSLSPVPTGQTLLIWGGATSVGTNAIQLALASGYSVITTCSPKNFPYVKRLGASLAFDYNSPTAITDIISAFQDRKFAGALSIGSIQNTNRTAAAAACLEITDQISHGNKFVATALPPPDKIPEGVKVNFIQGGSLRDNEVSHAIYEHFLPKALAEGKFVPSPEPEVVGKGLESIQKGFEVQQQGVSGKKVVVSLSS